MVREVKCIAMYHIVKYRCSCLHHPVPRKPQVLRRHHYGIRCPDLFNYTNAIKRSQIRGHGFGLLCA